MVSKKKKTKWKVANLVFFIFLIFILALYGQYVYLSLSRKIYGIDMTKFAANRNTVTKEKIAERGHIFDVNGDTLALNVTSYTLIAYLDEKRVGKYSFNVQAQYLEIWIDSRGRPKKSDTSEDQSDTKKGNSMVKDTQVKT